MKNKEIEELLNDLKNTADTSFFAVCSSKEELEKMPRGVCKFLSLNDKQAKLLLSYIEQLEKRNKELYEGFIATQEELTDYATENEQLENKYDKALETLVDFNMHCERDDFNLLDTDYCEVNCSNDDEQYKKCWNRWIEWRLENE